MSEHPDPPPVAPPLVSGDRIVRCASCGYDLRGVAIGSRCPECATPVFQGGHPQLSNGKAITSMVLGIVSLVTCFFYGLPGLICGIIAVVFAKKADLAIQAGEAPVTSRGMAQTGRICGWIGIILGALYFLLMAAYIVFVIALAASAAGGGGAAPFGP